jgi:hypothetical protein
MTELARPDNYQDADPTMVVYSIPNVGFSTSTTLFTTGANSLWRLRVLTIAGNTTGTVGTLRLGLNLAIAAQAGRPWTNGSNNAAISATVAQDIVVGDAFNYTWSTETTSAYFSQDANQGWVAQAGLPLVFLPENTLINIVRTRSAGGDGNAQILDGFFQMEKFPQGAVVAGSAGYGQTYLLPAVP